MRVFTIAYADGSSYTVEADVMTVDDRLAAFFIGEPGGELVGLAQGWVAIASEQQVFGHATITTRPVTVDGSLIPGQMDAYTQAQQAVSERQHRAAEARHVLAQTSPPDEEGVSTDPAPDQEQADVDANPREPSPSGSTGADDPPADGEDPRADTLRVRLGNVFAEQRGNRKLMSDYIAHCDASAIPRKLSACTLLQMEHLVEWFTERGVNP